MTIAYGIFSGGLDSMLAAKILMDQGLEVRLLTFVTPFFNARRATVSGRIIGQTTRAIEITRPHLEMLQSPKYGYGRFMNPCIDCHALMFNTAGKIMEEEGGDFIFSGEVLGQRPKSQTLQALGIVARQSGYGDHILRPLSARRLPETHMEKAGLVDRNRLLDFSGRSRKPQMELAGKLQIEGYPSPAGGCALTDTTFSIRLRELMSRSKNLDVRDVDLLKWGRHFRLPGGDKLVVGRNEGENQALLWLSQPEDFIFSVERIPGPIVLLAGESLLDKALAASITVSYSDAPDGVPHQVRITHDGQEDRISGIGQKKESFAHLMIKA
jgi:tRNA-specific 2-thiouridylase